MKQKPSFLSSGRAGDALFHPSGMGSAQIDVYVRPHYSFGQNHMFNYQESMDNHLAYALEALKGGDTNGGLSELVMALSRDEDCRLDAIKEKVGVSYGKTQQGPIHAHEPNTHTFKIWSAYDWLEATLDIYGGIDPALKSCGDGCCNLGHGAFLFDGDEDSHRAVDECGPIYIGEAFRFYLFEFTQEVNHTGRISD